MTFDPDIWHAAWFHLIPSRSRSRVKVTEVKVQGHMRKIGAQQLLEKPTAAEEQISKLKLKKETAGLKIF